MTLSSLFLKEIIWQFKSNAPVPLSSYATCYGLNVCDTLPLPPTPNSYIEALSLSSYIWRTFSSLCLSLFPHPTPAHKEEVM